MIPDAGPVLSGYPTFGFHPLLDHSEWQAEVNFPRQLVSGDRSPSRIPRLLRYIPIVAAAAVHNFVTFGLQKFVFF